MFQLILNEPVIIKILSFENKLPDIMSEKLTRSISLFVSSQKLPPGSFSHIMVLSGIASFSNMFLFSNQKQEPPFFKNKLQEFLNFHSPLQLDHPRILYLNDNKPTILSSALAELEHEYFSIISRLVVRGYLKEAAELISLIINLIDTPVPEG